MKDRWRFSLALVVWIWLGGSIANLAAQPASTNGPVFNFVQMTDTHIGVADNLARTRKVVEAINALPLEVAFVAHTGDLFHSNIQNQTIRESTLALLKQLKAPFYIAPGNHDIVARNLAVTLRLYTNHVGPLHRAVEHQGVRLIFFYSEPLRERTVIDGYQPLAWLQSALAADPDKPALIFHHAPFAQNIYAKEITLQWHKIISQYPVKAVLTGHLHLAGLVWAGETPVYIAPPVTKVLGRQAAFRVYRYDRGKLSYSTKSVE